MQSTHWARLKADRWDVVRASIGDSELPSGVAQILVRDLPVGAIGYVPGGPLLDPRSGHAAAFLVHEMLEAAAARGVRALIVQPPPAAYASLERELRATGFSHSPVITAPVSTIEIDLTLDHDQILAQMRASRRRNIRKALRSDVEVSRGDAADLTAFHDLYRSTAARQGFGALSREYVRRQWEILHPRGMLELFLARVAGRPIAGATVTRWGDRTVFKLAGWSREATDSSLRPNDLLHWEIIKWSKAKGCRVYDLGGFERATAERLLAGGAADESIRTSPGQFKLGFGGQPVVLPMPLWRLDPAPLRLAQRPLGAVISRVSSVDRIAARLRGR